MNPNYGIILWIVIGGLAGWIGSKVMGTDKDQGIVLNVLIGVGGALLGGFLARSLMSDNPGNNGVFISFFIALLGACIVIAAWKGMRRVISN